jgi:hypothetical protein
LREAYQEPAARAIALGTTTPRRPTARQLAYLKSLAERTGQTFTYPTNSREASREIARLKQTRPSTHTERRIEPKLIADGVVRVTDRPAGAAQPGDRSAR